MCGPVAAPAHVNDVRIFDPLVSIGGHGSDDVHKRISFGEVDGETSVEIAFKHNCWKHEEDLLIRYEGVSSFTLDIAVPSQDGPRGVVILDEILPRPDGCSHEIVFRPGTVTVSCRDLIITWVESDCPEKSPGGRGRVPGGPKGRWFSGALRSEGRPGWESPSRRLPQKIIPRTRFESLVTCPPVNAACQPRNRPSSWLFSHRISPAQMNFVPRFPRRSWPGEAGLEVFGRPRALGNGRGTVWPGGGFPVGLSEGSARARASGGRRHWTMTCADRRVSR